MSEVDSASSSAEEKAHQPAENVDMPHRERPSSASSLKHFIALVEPSGRTLECMVSVQGEIEIGPYSGDSGEDRQDKREDGPGTAETTVPRKS